MSNKIVDRRKAKKSKRKKTDYRILKYELRRETYDAYENWWKEEWQSLELFEKQRRIDLLYARIKQITEEKKARNTGKQIKKKEIGSRTDIGTLFFAGTWVRLRVPNPYK